MMIHMLQALIGYHNWSRKKKNNLCVQNRAAYQCIGHCTLYNQSMRGLKMQCPLVTCKRGFVHGF